MDVITWILCKKYAKNYTDEQIKIVSKGMTYKGSVASKEDLPLSGNTLGDLYTTTDLGREYVWTLETDSGELSDWQELSKVDLSMFYTKALIDEKITAIEKLIPEKVSDLENDAGFITDEALQGYATETWVENKHYLTEHLDISHLATKNELASDVAILDAKIDEVEEKIPSLDGYATESWVEGKGYLTEHQDISHLATKTELAAKQDTLSVDTREDYNGIIINNNVISRDPDIIPSVDYVDASITDTMRYIDQQDASEHAGRVAGDNLLQTAIDKKQDLLKVNEANPTVDLNSLTIDNVIYKIAGEAKIGKTFTTQVTVGNLAAGTSISSDTKIADILYNILFGTPTVELKAFYYAGPTDPETITSDWESETITNLVKDTNLVHTFNTSAKSYYAIAFSKSLGELVHIYQNDLTSFDLLSNWTPPKVVTYEGAEYYIYAPHERYTAGVDKYELRWK